MFEHSSDGIHIKDNDLCYRYINQACLTEMELEQEEMLSKLDTELPFAQYATHYNAHDMLAMKDHIYYQLDESCTKSGKTIFTLAQKFPLKDESGKIHGVLSIGKALDYNKLLQVLPSITTQQSSNLKITIDKKILLNISHISVDLSAREIEVLCCFLQGKSTKSISKKLGITERTTIFHINNIKDKWACNSKEAVFAKAVEKKFIKFPSLWQLIPDAFHI